MSEKEYTVIVNNREDLADIEAELTASSGSGPIPDRTVDVANPRPGSKIQTHFMLTDEEAANLRTDPRIRAVEIPPDQRDDIQIGLWLTQTGNFTRSNTLNNTDVNWGLRRCIETTNTYNNQAVITGGFLSALGGKGVDIVIQDSGIDKDHPEFQDLKGNSRVQEIDWYTASGISGTQSANFYTDYDGHGTHCAGISAGKTYGWAKAAHIYAQKLGGLEGASDPGTGIPLADAFDTIRLWHNAKTNGRPTVVNMSWGYQTQQTTDPTSGNYRGSAWVWNPSEFQSGYDTRSGLWQGTGVVQQLYFNGLFFYSIHPVQVAAVDAEIDDMINDGIHVVIAAGNDRHKTDVPGGDDYDNTVVFGGTTYNYHRPSSPHSANAINVGNIDYHTQELIGDVGTDVVSDSSTRGPAIDVWAPGTNIMSTAPRDYNSSKYTDVLDYPADTDYKIMEISGTSMAAPQVAGVLALHLESLPKLTPAQAKERLINDARTDVIYETTNNDTDYTQTQDSIMGAPNKFLYSRYGVAQPLTINGFTQTSGIVGATYALSASSTSINEGDTVTVTLTTTNIPDNFEVAYAVSGIQSSDLSSGDLSGNFTVISNTANISFTLAEDITTEGVETLTVSLNNGQSSVAIAIADTSASNYALSTSAASVNEGGSFTITLTTTGVVDGTTQAYTVTGVSASDISESLTGTFTINSNTASATFNVTNDFSTEGSETFTLSLDGRGESVDVIINDTSGTPVYNNLVNDTGGLNDVDEGETLTFTLTGTNIQEGTTVGYTVSGVTSGDISGASLTGNITMSGGTGSVTFTIAEDATSEGSESLVFTLDATDSNGANTGGLSQTITINDTSESPAADYTMNVVGVSGNPRYLQFSGADRIRTFSSSTNTPHVFNAGDTVNYVNNSGRTLYITDTVDDISAAILDGSTYNFTVGSAGTYAIRADGNPSVNDETIYSRFVYTDTITANTTNYDVNTLMTTAGWDGSSNTDVSVTVNSGYTVYSNSVFVAAINFPTLPSFSSVTITNSGVIMGCGGNGGDGGDGQDGGDAIRIPTGPIDIEIINNSGATIAGGGGGGGGAYVTGSNAAYYSGGGGGAGGGIGGGASSVAALGANGSNGGTASSGSNPTRFDADGGGGGRVIGNATTNGTDFNQSVGPGSGITVTSAGGNGGSQGGSGAYIGSKGLGGGALTMTPGDGGGSSRNASGFCQSNGLAAISGGGGNFGQAGGSGVTLNNLNSNTAVNATVFANGGAAGAALSGATADTVTNNGTIYGSGLV